MIVHLIMHKSLRNRLYNPMNKDAGTINWINWERSIDRLDTKLRTGSTITRIFVKNIGVAK
jgi:hypothetical protein